MPFLSFTLLWGKSLCTLLSLYAKKIAWARVNVMLAWNSEAALEQIRGCPSWTHLTVPSSKGWGVARGRQPLEKKVSGEEVLDDSLRNHIACLGEGKWSGCFQTDSLTAQGHALRAKVVGSSKDTWAQEGKILRRLRRGTVMKEREWTEEPVSKETELMDQRNKHLN